MAEQRYDLIPEERWAWLGPAYRGIDADLRALESGAGAADPSGVTAASPRRDVAAFLPAQQPVSTVTASATWYIDTSMQWAKPLNALGALGGGHRIALIAQVPSSATEPLKVAEGTSLTDNYNPSNPRTDVPAGSEVSFSPGTGFLTAHFTTTPQAIRVWQSTGV